MRLLVPLGAVVWLCCLSCSQEPNISENLRQRHSESFWYDKPASVWTEAIPIGNGRLGAMVFGGIDEQLVLNENSIWEGPPLPDENLNGPELIAQMRALLFEGKYKEANDLCQQQFMVKRISPRAYQPLGFLHIKDPIGGEVSQYKRWLDYGEAIAHVEYERGGVMYHREYFASHPADLIIVKYKADQKGQINLAFSLDRPEGSTTTASGKELIISGQAGHNGQHLGVKFDGVVRIVPTGGSFKTTETEILVKEADEVEIYMTASTDYNLSQPTNPLQHNRLSKCREILDQAESISLGKTRKDHVEDYQDLFYRSTLDIELAENLEQSLDERIEQTKAGRDDPGLLLSYYEYCRYLLISGSRSGGIPINLQGIWNPLIEPPWNSDYHINININMGYWFAETGNLSECHEPFFSLTEGLVDNGRKTARNVLGVDRGFMALHTTDLWFHTNPFGLPVYGMYVGGASWCVHHLIEHYRFSQDIDFLEKRAYPLIKEAALFWIEWLVEHPESGLLVSGPTTSAENRYFAPDDSRGAICMGNAQDQEFAWNTLSDFITTCRILGLDPPELEEAKSALSNLAMPQIGPDGRLLEWDQSHRETQPGHRHLSHLWGLMPGHRITVDETPELAKAVEKSMDYRLKNKYDKMGWSLGWTANILTRLQQGNRAYDLIRDNYFSYAFPNMFVSAHKQVQVADMMGLPAAMIQFLLQSHQGKIDLLPAMPDSWSSGKVTGLRARGGFEVDIEWGNGKLVEARITSMKAQDAIVKYNGIEKTISFEPDVEQTVLF